MQMLVLGGARSGKSAYAEHYALHSTKQVIYIATAQALDSEMQARISHHRQQRPADWQTIEEPIYLASWLEAHNNSRYCLVVDCLTLWITNLLSHDDNTLLEQEITHLLNVLPNLQSDLLLVSNETGLGIVPLGELTRFYIDTMGRLHQSLAKRMDTVVFMVAGLPQTLKGS